MPKSVRMNAEAQNPKQSMALETDLVAPMLTILPFEEIELTLEHTYNDTEKQTTTHQCKKGGGKVWSKFLGYNAGTIVREADNSRLLCKGSGK